MNNKPVILVEGIYPQANNWNSVLFTKMVTPTQGGGGSLLSLATRGMGDPKIDGDKKLTVFANFTTESLQKLNIKVGQNINNLGFDFIYDIVEKYAPKLEDTDFDGEGNVMVEPVMNQSTGEVQLYNGKLMFRTTHLVEAATVAELPKSTPKPSRTGLIEDIFDQEKFVVDSTTGKKRKTAEYQQYLNTLYSFYVTPSSTIQFQKPVSMLEEVADEKLFQEA